MTESKTHITDLGQRAMALANPDNQALVLAILAQTAAVVRLGDIMAEQVQLTRELVRAAGETVTEEALSQEAAAAVERYLAQKRGEEARNAEKR